MSLHATGNGQAMSNSGGADQSMEKAIDVAVNWWASQLPNDIPSENVEQFKHHLRLSLTEKLQPHWDVTNLLRGSGFRSISVDQWRVDPVLTFSCQESKIPMDLFLRSVCRRGNDHIMFINPGEVRIRNGALLTTSSTPIWSTYEPVQPASSSLTPYSPTVQTGGNGTFTPNQSAYSYNPPSTTSSYQPSHRLGGYNVPVFLGPGGTVVQPPTAGSVTTPSAQPTTTATSAVPTAVAGTQTISASQAYIPVSQTSLPLSARSATAFHPNTPLRATTQAMGWHPENNTDDRRRKH